MKLNIFNNTPIDPFISHMRISYEENIRAKTEVYWRNVIAEEIKDYREDLMADIEYEYGYGSEYEACDSVLWLAEYVARNKKLPPLGES